MPIFRYNEQPGNYYAYLIEGSGNDANNGLTPETAVETLDRLVEILDTYAGASRRHAVIVKKRIYNEGITYARTAGRPITFEFVGGCEIDGSGASYLKVSSGDKCINPIIINYNSDNFTNNLVHTSSSVEILNGIIKQSNNAIFSLSQAANHEYYACIFTNSVIISATLCHNSNHSWLRQFKFNNCVLINLANGQATNLKVDAANCVIQNNPNLNIAASSLIDYCNIVGLLYNKDNAGWQALGQNLNGIGINPQFTDPTNGQYTVNQSSPCLYRGEGGEHIGIGEGFYLQANILYFQQSVINNFQLTTGRLGFIDPLDNAFIETNPIDIGQIITLESAELAAILPVVTGEFTAGPVHYSHW